MVFIGIDVGVTGAVAAVDRNGVAVDVLDLPIVSLGKFKFVDATRFNLQLRTLRGAENARVTMEFASFTKSALAASSMGRTTGSAVATVMMGGLPLEFVSPVKWKTAFGLTKKANDNIDLKKKAQAQAQLKFPNMLDKLERVKDHNRCEALLLAEYGRRVFAAGGAA